MVQVSCGSRSTSVMLLHASSYGQENSMAVQKVIFSPLWDRVVCVHTQRMHKVLFGCLCSRGAFPGPSAHHGFRHPMWNRGISKEGSEMRICITSKAQRGEERKLPVYQPAPPPMRNKIKKKKRFLCASCASVKFSKVFLLVLDQVQDPCGQSWVCLDYLLAKGFPLQSSV